MTWPFVARESMTLHMLSRPQTLSLVCALLIHTVCRGQQDLAEIGITSNGELFFGEQAGLRGEKVNGFVPEHHVSENVGLRSPVGMVFPQSMTVKANCGDVLSTYEQSEPRNRLERNCQIQEKITQGAMIISQCFAKERLATMGTRESRETFFENGIPVLRSSSLSFVDWYLSYVTVRRPVLVEQHPGQRWKGGKDDCLQQKLSSIKRGENVQGGINVLCPDTYDLPTFLPFETKLPFMPTEVFATSKNEVFSQNISRMGRHRVLVPFVGKIDIVICEGSVANEYVYPEFTNSGDVDIEFKGDVFNQNLAKYPLLRETKDKCYRTLLDSEHFAYIPPGFAVFIKSKSKALVARHSFVDEVNRNIDAEYQHISTRSIIRPPKEGMASALMNRIHKNTFRNWQWYVRLKSLVKESRLSAPVLTIKDIGRNRATISVHIEDDEETKHAAKFEIEWRLENPEAVEEIKSCDGHKHNFGLKVVNVSSDAKSLTLHEVDHLQEDTKYLVRVRTTSRFHGIVSPWAAWVKVRTRDTIVPSEPLHVNAQPCLAPFKYSPCISIAWGTPWDNGGLPLSGFILEYHERDRPQLNNTIQVDDLTTTVYNLRPGKEYLLRVAARNDLGLSEFSPFTQPVVIYSPMEHITQIYRNRFLHNAEHSESVAEQFFEYVLNPSRVQIDFNLKSKDNNRLPVVTLSDVLQRVFVYSSDGIQSSFPVWSAQHTPGLYDVHARLVRSIPSDACAPQLKNKAGIRGYIALIIRGNCPILTKVQAAYDAGAAAVVILDESGSCDRAFDHRCSAGSDKFNKEGFARLDKESLWKPLGVPTVMMRAIDYSLLLQ